MVRVVDDMGLTAERHSPDTIVSPGAPISCHTYRDPNANDFRVRRAFTGESRLRSFLGVLLSGDVARCVKGGVRGSRN